DLKDVEWICRRVRETGVDGVLLGRVTQGNPWIFRNKSQIKCALRSDADVTIHSFPVGLEERFHVLLEHGRHFEKHNTLRSFVGMRKHLAWYCNGSPGAAQLRAQMVRVSCIEEVVQCLVDYAGSLGSQFEPAESALREDNSRSSGEDFWLS
ncbi:MAG TPA: tRNA-dihydrouridine synthase, partial [Candidatus Binatia bacterium]|nr:tRNA-dihydrouridine synthase [Candidatus Binatia bacterium]